MVCDGAGASIDAGGSIDSATVQRIARELAAYIGPIAEIVVKRRASKCHSADELYRSVASEIDSLSDREKFLAERGS